MTPLSQTLDQIARDWVEAYQRGDRTLESLTELSGYTADATSYLAAAIYRAMQRKGQTWADQWMAEIAKRLNTP